MVFTSIVNIPATISYCTLHEYNVILCSSLNLSHTKNGLSASQYYITVHMHVHYNVKGTDNLNEDNNFSKLEKYFPCGKYLLL